jgi:protein-disulfide isomerase
MKEWRSHFETLTTAVMLCAAVALVWFGFRDRTAASARSTEIAIPKSPISLQGAKLQGEPAAPVILGMFTDFECPYCGRFATTILPEIQRRYVNQGTVALALWDFPLTSIHANAAGAAIAGECSALEGKFWELHDVMFADPKGLDRPGLIDKALKVGVRPDVFESCLDASSAGASVEMDKKLGQDLGVKGTPAFFVGQRQGSSLSVSETINGARPLESFTQALDKALAIARR